MKKIVGIFILLIFLSTLLTGCSSTEDNGNTDDDILNQINKP